MQVLVAEPISERAFSARLPHPEVPSEARPRRTHDGSACFEARLRRAPQHEERRGGHVRNSLAAAAVAASLGVAPALAVELDPKAVVYKLPDQIPWVENRQAGNAQAVVMGDPAKPGPYIVLVKWHAGNHFSRPHSHPNDRFITVLKGTWWVGSGSTFDTDATVSMPAGSVVTHFARQVHYDGAKDEDAILQIVGEGPGTSIPAAN